MIRGRAVSNLLWPAAAEADALALLPGLGFTGIELAPGKSVAGWPHAPEGLGALRARIEGQGLQVAALQGILFGVPGLALFGTAQERARLRAHLETVARVAGALGAEACVFGAPKARDPGALTPEAAFDEAADFFRAVAPAFADAGTALAFEGNAPVYGCRFATTTAEALALVQAVDHPGVRLQIDTGTIFLTGEPAQVIADAAPLACHFHVSEPDLAPLGSSGVDHAPLGTALAGTAYGGWISAEMREAPDWRAALDGAARLLARHYPSPAGDRAP